MKQIMLRAIFQFF